MATAVESLLTAPEDARTIGLAGRQRVHSAFLIKHTAQKMVKVYESILRSR
jgi:glycosyltransferase involved in cell wall biosynthesis